MRPQDMQWCQPGYHAVPGRILPASEPSSASSMLTAVLDLKVELLLH